MKDNIGNAICIGDSVFCLTGGRKNTLQTVSKIVVAHDDLEDQIRVYFDQGSWLPIYNVISASALGVTATETKSTYGCDTFGNPLHPGDKVLYRHPKEFYAEIGTVKKLAAKSCLLKIAPNRFGETEYRKKYEELISLTALGLETLEIKHCHD